MADGNGHGTHVAGTLTGSIGTAAGWSPDAATGMAPNAKLAFMDIGSGTTDTVRAECWHGIWVTLCPRLLDMPSRVHTVLRYHVYDFTSLPFRCGRPTI